ncbi:hypothetical protein [Bacillus sp. V2I10]|uniref:hypothetical protein n=1 Tax=Bacillus sp. V2I10 TaxID=3042276 RepID=UPI002781BB4A|nr:hypothetical protein [Bacillus sp. V2I10]MDQ0861885.1 hypothetical protein [Bacillus sp. V2I10]
MKVLSMIQPWASLFALGEVKYETRSWRTAYRGQLAIHTSKKIDKTACRHAGIQALLGKHGYSEKKIFRLAKLLRFAGLKSVLG